MFLSSCVVPKAELIPEYPRIYCKNVLDVGCQTQGRLKLMIELYVSEKSVINSKYSGFQKHPCCQMSQFVKIYYLQCTGLKVETQLLIESVLCFI
jgi:hypothetical protein